MTIKKPYLQFDFSDSDRHQKPLVFSNPIAILEARRLDEVLGMLEKVERFVQEGKYAAGYVSYEAAPAFEKSFKVQKNPKMPLIWFGIYDAPQSEDISRVPLPFHVSDWKSPWSREKYQAGFEKIKNEIEEGNTYQVNYTMRLRSRFEGDSFAFYKQLSKAQSSKYCAYLDIGEYSILSASPELFFKLENHKVTTRPMKGTVQRGRTLQEDRGNAEWLYNSEKNRSENLMIVDLLRNDLGRIAKAGTVKVPELFAIEKYPTVWQMTSGITGELQPRCTFLDVFKALFPCGSITGAPKISTMGIITEVEDEPREVYCGAIGYITPEGKAVFNVPIRTVSIHNQSGEACYGAGGGITWDSGMKDEYHEAFVKARLLTQKPFHFELLESLRLEEGGYFILPEHMERLQNSAEYFDFPFEEKKVLEALRAFAEKHKNGLWKVRCLLSPNGDLNVEGAELSKNEDGVTCSLAQKPISSDNIFLYHKTTNRKVYDDFKKEGTDFDVLLWNERGELTEFTFGSLVLELKGELLTPPVSSGLLPGTFREHLLKTGKIKEQTLTKSDLEKAQNTWHINSVRKWVKVKLKA
ncbi:aminodeoxychorismate synthase component I [Peribacillus kribbensis]|uniref:aminodeoxychorismate synthase component I n=1 Tax=Peribacillus kribbensis TaxID=356658 RepID=UPI00040206E3|nr:aminodeoxychorismate synthase component I [Peribacillus kribbensis]